MRQLTLLLTNNKQVIYRLTKTETVITRIYYISRICTLGGPNGFAAKVTNVEEMGKLIEFTYSKTNDIGRINSAKNFAIHDGWALSS